MKQWGTDKTEQGTFNNKQIYGNLIEMRRKIP